MAYYIAYLILVFLEEFPCRTEGYLVDILVHLLTGHSYTAVYDFQSLLFLIQFYTDGKVSKFTLEITGRCKGLHLLRGIHCIGHQLPEKNLMV